MAAGFNFGFGDGPAVRTSKPTLAPWDIYDVEFKGCEIRELAGKKDTSKSYKVLDIKFENEYGKFTKTLFFPNPATDSVRPKNDNGKERPSNFEVTFNTVKQLIYVLNPTGYEKLAKVAGKFTTFSEFAEAAVKLMTPVIGAKTQLKLIGVTDKNGTLNPDIPRVVACQNDQPCWWCDNYVGSNLAFTAYEDTKRKEYQAATPSKVKEEKEKDALDLAVPASAPSAVPVSAPAPSKGSEDINVDDLIAEL